MTAPLIERLGAVFRKPDETTSEKLLPLREELAQEVERIDAAAAAADEDAFDPKLLGLPEAKQRETEAKDLKSEAHRLRIALDRLGVIIGEQKGREENARKREIVSEAHGLIDVAVKGIHKEYPAIQKGLVKLQQDIGRARLKVHEANANLPEGQEPLDMPEAVAFDYPDSPAGNVIGARPAQIAEMVVPDLKNWACPAWPPQWNGHHPNRISEQALDSFFARGNKK
jgi:hypothetical protein